MTDNPIAADIARKVLGAPGVPETEKRARLFRTALRLLATGEPVSPVQLAAAAEVCVADLKQGPAGNDVEYDDQGRIIGWGLTSVPTPHKFTVNGVALYTWCALDALGFPRVIGATAHVESSCPATGTTIRLTVDPDKGVTAVDPATVVMSIVDPARFQPNAARATGCNLSPFFASAADAQDWQSQNPGMTVLPVADAYEQLARPMIEALLGGDPAPGCC